MKSDVFYWVLNLSLHGGLVCLILWLLRTIRPIPRRLIYLLWIGPALRLTIPFAPSLPWSFMGLLKQLGSKTVVLNPGTPSNADPLTIHAVNSWQFAKGYFPITYRTDTLKNLFETCALVWVIVAAACFLTMTALYGMSLWELRDAKHLRGRIWVSERVVSPGLFGILRPRILVPPGMKGRLLEYVEAHETEHRRRMDNLWRLFALGICCVHWFNPVVWFSLKLFFADMEFSCDERVVQKLRPDERRSYALALLSVAKGQDLFVSAFGGARLRLRIQRVLSYRRLTAGATIVFALLTGAVLSALAFG